MVAAACIQFGMLAVLFLWKLDDWGKVAGVSSVLRVTMIETEVDDDAGTGMKEDLAMKTPVNHPFPDDVLAVGEEASSWTWPEPVFMEIAVNESSADEMERTFLEVERGEVLPQKRKETTQAGNTRQSSESVAGNESSMKLASYKDSPSPPYPSEARRAGQEGVVLLMIRIDKEGFPEKVSIAKSSGVKVLDEVSVQWVRKNWTFHPALEDRNPVASDMMAPVRFELN